MVFFNWPMLMVWANLSGTKKPREWLGQMAWEVWAVWAVWAVGPLGFPGPLGLIAIDTAGPPVASTIKRVPHAHSVGRNRGNAKGTAFVYN